MTKVLDIRFLLLFSTFIFISTSYGQSTLGIHAGGAFPVGEFGEADEGGAGIGFGGGINWDYKLKGDWLYLNSGFTFNYNPTSRAADKFIEEEVGNIIHYMDFQNYTLNFGPKFKLKTDTEISFSICPSLALNVFNAGDLDVEYIYGITPDPNDPTGPGVPLYRVAQFSFEPALGVGFVLDVDVNFGDRFGAKFYYGNLGNFEILGELESSYDDPISYIFEQNVSLIGLGIYVNIIR